MHVYFPQETLQKQGCGVWHCRVSEASELMPDLAPLFDSYPLQDGVIDVKIHMLMPGQFPCIPNWHYDLVPRNSAGEQVMESRDISKKMYMILSGPPFTEFQDGRTLRPWTWSEFTQFDLHRGHASKKHQWRLFARVAPKSFIPPASGSSRIRRHCQVYLDAGKFKW